ncbi:hypothetical protein, partial [Faecalibacterium prausnitzii]|uniref:hypothetical protein n=1 Tax=Faecalibacterium prausnitzii TaxID=853 RepID=UPI001F2F5966
LIKAHRANKEKIVQRNFAQKRFRGICVIGERCLKIGKMTYRYNLLDIGCGSIQTQNNGGLQP